MREQHLLPAVAACVRRNCHDRCSGGFMIKNRMCQVRSALLVGIASCAFVPGLAVAQVSAGQEEVQTEVVEEQAAGGVANISSEDPVGNEIIVTGTLLRGVAPVGSSIISAGQEKIQSSGATTSNELLATIPQVTNLFGNDPNRRYGIAANQIQIARPNLRNLSPDNASSSATLVLFDGHRVATAGATQASIDPDLLPTAAIERVEVVTDGGSAIYGADAVGGVINFITRKRFDGAKVDFRYGIADEYWQVDANAIVGRDWGSGSIYVAYTYNKNDALFGRDRDYINNYVYDANGNISTGTNPPFGFRDQTCDNPNFAVSGAPFTLVGGAFTAGTTYCDAADRDVLIPEVERHGVLASLTQDLNDSLSIDVRAFYSQRDTRGRGQRTLSAVNIPSTNAWYQQIPGTAAGATQSATLSLAPALGTDQLLSGTSIKEWGFAAELKADLTDNWQLRTLFNYSSSDSSYFINGGFNTANLDAARVSSVQSQALNPYNVALTNPTVLAAILDNQTGAQTKDQLLDLRAIVEGSLLTLPGGDVRLAAGYEYMHTFTQNRAVTAGGPVGTLQSTPYNNYTRRVHALFGEVQIPLFGPDNATAGIQSFVISAQGRYDHYSDFGGTFNPKIGATYKPVDWLSLRGNWSKSFNAPSTLDQLGANARIGAFAGPPVFLFSLEPFPVTLGLVAQNAAVLAIQGSKANLEPQTAETWSVGFDVEPPFVPGLRASLSYYNVKFNNILSTPSPFNSGIFAAFPDITEASAAGIPRDVATAFANLVPGGATAPGVAQALNCNNNDATCLTPGPNGSLVYALIDFRTGNYGSVKASGLDWTVNYRMDTGFGSLDAAFYGNLQLTRRTAISPGAPFVDSLGVPNGAPDLRMQAVLGANVGDNFRGQVTWNYLSGSLRTPTAAWADARIPSFDTFDLFFKYDFKGERLLRDLSLTLNVRNVFDADPPFVRTGSGYENGRGSLLGRTFIFGVSKQF
jgi:iron complex outermembrane recepter protein